ncbi:hypothetical protein QVD17_01724 [Tagetes erecta]|uniref:Uncharacterized protein n=1 Tax=Tagetes erecta TaxID=13708 RepID=A0AAD8LB46_TARER|nr:hypothetical protein QVD17_01724 [Tagetes erecta]
MLNHHLAGLLGLGSLSWAGHQVHVSLPINQFLNAGVDPKEIPLPHEFILNRDLLAQLYPIPFYLLFLKPFTLFFFPLKKQQQQSHKDRYLLPPNLFVKIKQKLDFDCYDEDFDFSLCDVPQNWLIPSAVCGGVLFSPFLAVEYEEDILTKPNPIGFSANSDLV